MIELCYPVHVVPQMTYKALLGNQYCLAAFPFEEKLPFSIRSLLSPNIPVLVAAIYKYYPSSKILHDAQYTSEEYKTKQGWGHSSMEDAIQFARLNRVKKLLLSHHDPMHSDQQLRSILSHLKEKFGATVAFDMAVEGSTIEL